MTKLTPTQLNNSRSWIHDILVAGGLVSPQRDRQPSVKGIVFYDGGIFWDRVRTDFKIICDAILQRPVDFKKLNEIDSALNRLSPYKFPAELSTNLDLSWDSRAFIRKPAEMLAKYIANFCAENHFWWDDSKTTSYERDEIRKTNIGKALYDFNCFTSQATPVARRAKSASASSGTTTSGTTAVNTTTSGPKNNYKSTGPQSANVINLVGQPGVKIGMQGGTTAFCIEADKIGKNTPNAFIKPLDAKYNSGSATVFMGSGNGYTDCKCWFRSLKEATDFCSQVNNKFNTKFNNIHISKANVDPNGYYEVKTEFGNCFIKAVKLNECLKEATDAEAKRIEAVKAAIRKEIEDGTAFDPVFEAYSEGFFRES